MTAKIEELEQLFKETEGLTPEKMESLVSESIKVFDEISKQMTNGTEKEQEEALDAVLRLKEGLENQAEKAVEQLDITSSELEAFVSNPNNFSNEEWEALQKAKGELDEYNKSLSVEDVKKDAKTKKTKTQWVAG